MTRRRGLTLLETLVAVAILAIGVTATARLLARSVTTIGVDRDAGRAMLAARALLAEAALHPPEPGVIEGIRPDGLRFEREVRPTGHPRLREVRVRVQPADGGAGCELLELVRVPPA